MNVVDCVFICIYILILSALFISWQWDGLEDKSSVLIYGGGAIVAVWLSSIVVGAINSVPLVPNFFFL